MTSLPAYCPKCKSIFPFSEIGIAEGVSVALSNIGTNCPVCGFKDARVSDGVYKATKDAIEILSGPDSTRAMAEALKLVVERFASGELSREQAVQQASDLSPKYGTLLNGLSSLGIPALMLLIAIIALYLQYEGNKSSSEDAHKILDAITEQSFLIQDKDKRGVDAERRTPSSKEPERKSTSIKDPSTRRADINKKRRNTLRSRRRDFGGSRCH